MASAPLYRAGERPAKINIFTRRRLPLLIIGLAALILIGTFLGTGFTSYNNSNAVTWYSTSNQQTDNALIKAVTVQQATSNQTLLASNQNNETGAALTSNNNAAANRNNTASNPADNTKANAAGAVNNSGANR